MVFKKLLFCRYILFLCAQTSSKEKTEVFLYAHVGHDTETAISDLIDMFVVQINVVEWIFSFILLTRSFNIVENFCLGFCYCVFGFLVTVCLVFFLFWKWHTCQFIMFYHMCRASWNTHSVWLSGNTQTLHLSVR